MKKTYIIPSIAVYKINVANGILLTGSDINNNNQILGDGGGTDVGESGGFEGVEVRGESDWDIW